MAGKRQPRPTIAKLTAREITPDDWPLIEQLFGEKGACGGCWCMYWRVAMGGKTWSDRTNDQNRKAFKRLVKDGHVIGVLAFSDDEPVGWCCIGPREDFPRLARVKALATNWSEKTWSVTCFYIPSKWRSQGVATALLDHAIKVAKKHGAKELEGYPVKSTKGDGAMIPGAFAWTGIPNLFEKQKFVDITLPNESRPVYVKRFK